MGCSGLVVGAGAVAGAETSVPVATGVRERERRLFATFRVGINEHCIVAPGTEVNVKRSPDLRACMETVVGVAAGPVMVAAAAVVAAVAGPVFPVCNATAV